MSGIYVTIVTEHPDKLGGKLPNPGDTAIWEIRTCLKTWGIVDLSKKDIVSYQALENPDMIRSYNEHGSDCSRILLRSESQAGA